MRVSRLHRKRPGLRAGLFVLQDYFSGLGAHAKDGLDGIARFKTGVV
jgi:hypothetical protein